MCDCLLTAIMEKNKKQTFYSWEWTLLSLMSILVPIEHLSRSLCSCFSSQLLCMEVPSRIISAMWQCPREKDGHKRSKFADSSTNARSHDPWSVELIACWLYPYARSQWITITTNFGVITTNGHNESS
jgi:hypothetical protein